MSLIGPGESDALVRQRMDVGKLHVCLPEPIPVSPPLVKDNLCFRVNQGIAS